MTATGIEFYFCYCYHFYYCFLTAKLYTITTTIAYYCATTTRTISTTEANTTLPPQPPAPQIDISHSRLSIDNTNRYKVCHDHGSCPRLQQTVRQTRPGDVLFFSFSGYGLQASGLLLPILRAVALVTLWTYCVCDS